MKKEGEEFILFDQNGLFGDHTMYYDLSKQAEKREIIRNVF